VVSDKHYEEGYQQKGQGDQHTAALFLLVTCIRRTRTDRQIVFFQGGWHRYSPRPRGDAGLLVAIVCPKALANATPFAGLLLLGLLLAEANVQKTTGVSHITSGCGASHS